MAGKNVAGVCGTSRSGNSLRATARPVSSTRDVGSGHLGSITAAVIDLLYHFVQEVSSACVCPCKANGSQ